MLYAGLFLAGLAQDWLNSMYVSAIAGGNRMRATLLSGVTTILSFLVFSAIIQHAVGAALFAYALGNCVGTFISVKPRATATA